MVTSTSDPYVLADPEEVGISRAALDELRDRARREIDEGLLPSCQLAVARHGRLVAFETFGEAAPGSRYIIFSCTKGITAGAIYLLLSDGSLEVSTRVAEIVPEFATNGKEVVTVEQLLTHAAGFPYAPLDPHKIRTREERLAKFEQWRLNWEPGTRFEYHPLSAHWVLGEIIQRLSGQDIRSFVAERITTPLGLRSLAVGEPIDRQGDLNHLVGVGQPPTAAEIEAATGIPGIDVEDLIGEVTQKALLAFDDPDVLTQGAPGGGGISTAADLALYYQALLHNTGGLWDGSRLLGWCTDVRNDLPDPMTGVPAHRSLGLQVAGDPPDAQRRGFGHGVSPRTFGHDGAGGQIACVDPDSGISFSYLTNGLDAHVIRQGRRNIGLSSRAAQLVT